MSALFRFPCGCGVEHAVAPYQAGESIRCQCGRTLEVPTMRQLRDYPRIEARPDRSKPTWSATRGVVFNLGLVVALVSLAALAVFGRQRANLDLAKPELPDAALYDLEVSSWTVDMAWRYWTLAQQTDLNYRLTPRYQEARRQAARLAVYLVTAGTGLVAGLAAMLGALWGRRAPDHPPASAG